MVKFPKTVCENLNLILKHNYIRWCELAEVASKDKRIKQVFNKETNLYEWATKKAKKNE